MTLEELERNQAKEHSELEEDLIKNILNGNCARHESYAKWALGLLYTMAYRHGYAKHEKHTERSRSTNEQDRMPEGVIADISIDLLDEDDLRA